MARGIDVELELVQAIGILKHCLEQERAATPKTWDAASKELDRATQYVAQCVARSSPLDRISARRQIAELLKPSPKASPGNTATCQN